MAGGLIVALFVWNQAKCFQVKSSENENILTFPMSQRKIWITTDENMPGFFWFPLRGLLIRRVFFCPISSVNWEPTLTRSASDWIRPSLLSNVKRRNVTSLDGNSRLIESSFFSYITSSTMIGPVKGDVIYTVPNPTRNDYSCFNFHLDNVYMSE